MEDINQLTGRGIPIIQELAKRFGVAESEVRKMVETGKVEFENLDAAFDALTSTGGKFSGMMERQSRTIAGMWSSLKDNFNALLRDMATPVTVALQPKLQELLGWMTANGPKVQKTLTDLTQSVMALAEAAARAAAVVVPALARAADLADLLGVSDPPAASSPGWAWTSAALQGGCFRRRRSRRRSPPPLPRSWPTRSWGLRTPPSRRSTC
jgi:phage tail tape-measure protein